MKTEAEKFAAELNDDGQNFSEWNERVERYGARDWQPFLPQSDAGAVDFKDGSRIVTSSGGWDLAVVVDNRCHCWAGVGHSDDCDLVGGDK